MFHLNLSVDSGHFLYHVFTALGLLVPFVFAWMLGKKNGYATATWLTILAILNALMIIGSRLGAFNASDWAAFFQNGYWQAETPKTAVGGLLLALVGYQILKRWFRLPASAADTIMLGLPLGAAVTRLGCLSAGCCFGTPANGWWSVTFGPGSSAFEAQTSCGAIATGAASTLPLHPVQLDLVISNLVIFAVLWYFRPKLRPGNLAVMALMLMAASRFGSEFFRDLATNRGATGQLWLGIKTVQWASLVVIAISGFYLWHNSRKTAVQQPVFRTQSALKLSGIMLPLSLLIWIFQYQLSVLETLVLGFSFFPALIAIGVAIWKNEAAKWVKWPSTALVSGAMLVQVLVQADSVINPSIAARPVNPKYSWWEAGAGGAVQRFKDYEATTSNSGCDSRTTVYRDRVILNQTSAIEGSFHQLKGRMHSSFGARLGYMNTTTKHGFPESQGGFPFGAINTSVDGRLAGINLGMQLLPKEAELYLGRRKSPATLALTGGVRFGNFTKYSFDIQYRERQQFLYYRYPEFTVGLVNWGFNDPTGQKYLRVGLANISAQNGSSMFGAARIPFWEHKMSVETGFYYGFHDSNYYAFSLGLRYHFKPKTY